MNFDALHVIDTVIKIPNLRKPLTLLHIADLHLTETDERDSAYVIELAAQRKPIFPHAAAVLQLLKEYIKEYPPDYTVLTGDILDFPSEKNIELLNEFLHANCKNFLYLLGNHDWWTPTDCPNEETQGKRYPKFYSITNGNPDFQVIDAGGVLLIGLDNSLNQITAFGLAKLKAELQKGLPCILFYHVPMCIDTLIGDVVRKWKQPIHMMGIPEALWGEVPPLYVPAKETVEFCELIRQKHLPITAAACGHLHFAHEDSFCENRIQYITPCACLAENHLGVVRRIRIEKGEI